jgi:NAD(P)-dependent dehydrogenase (short-subunit alcohol dehydrogenase family)
MSATDSTANPHDSSPQRLFDVSGLGAVVTGAASGLGFAMARVLARNGARVTMLDSSPLALADAAEALVAEGLLVRSAVVDITDRAALDEAAAAAAAWEGGLDIVIANAGISSGLGRRFGNGVADVDPARWEQVLDVNLTGTFSTVAACVGHLNPGTGRVIVISSVAGLRPDPLVGYAYSSSKAAVTLLAQNLATELAPRGICVNVIAPGSFATSIGAGNPGNAAMREALANATALGRLADPSEIEGITLLLSGPSSRFITGAVMTIDGGVSVNAR